MRISDWSSDVCSSDLYLVCGESGFQSAHERLLRVEVGLHRLERFAAPGAPAVRPCACESADGLPDLHFDRHVRRRQADADDAGDDAAVRGRSRLAGDEAWQEIGRASWRARVWH